MRQLSIVEVAALCHEVNRQYCMAIGDDSQKPWLDSPEWQRSSAVSGVHHRLDNPLAPPSASHDSWMRQKLAEGWKYGAVKDPEKKEHPCIAPFEELSPEQRVKDYLFTSTVMSLREVGMIKGER